MRRTAPLLALALSIAILSSCAPRQSVPTLPPVLDGEGLVVGRFYVAGLSRMENASIEFSGLTLPSGLVEGYVAAALPPGKHTLKRLKAQGHLLAARVVEEAPLAQPAGGYRVPTYIYVPGQTIQYTTLAVDREFVVEAGRVTNLGLMAYFPEPKATPPADGKGRSYHVANLDNGAEALAFLDANYPDLMATIKNREIIRAPATYVTAADLPKVRRAIAFHEQNGPHVVAGADRLFVYGRAGTIVSLRPDPARKDQPLVDILDTGTLADVVGGVRRGDQVAFLTSDARVLTWSAAGVSRSELPVRSQPIALEAVGERGLLAVDNRLRLFTAPSPEGPWTASLAHLSKTPRSDVDTAAAGSWTYLSVGTKGALQDVVAFKEGMAEPQPVAPPQYTVAEEQQGWRLLIGRPAGLFVLYFGGGRSFFFRPSDTLDWRLRNLPDAGCKPPRIDATGKELLVECGKAKYRSTDSGQSWSSPTT